jgi:hypothetical protein
MDKIELSAREMRTIMKALYDSEDDAAGELHDNLADHFARDEGMEHGTNTATLTVQPPVG